MNTAKLRQERKKLVELARKLIDGAEKENRALRAEEQEQWDTLMREVDGCKQRIDNLEAMGKTDDDERDGEEDDLPVRDDAPPDEDKQVVPRSRRTSPNSTHERTVRMPGETGIDFQNRSRRSRVEYRAAFLAYMQGGFNALHGSAHSRAIQADADVTGGYMVAPQQFMAELIKFVDNLVIIRQKATKHTVAQAQSLGAPSLDTDISDSDWTSELATGNEDTAMAFGKRELHPHPLAKRLKVSNKLLRASVIDAEKLVRERLAYKFAVSEEKAFMTGTGAQQPLGLFTASARGISTGRDITVGSTTNFIADNLFDVKFGVKPQYQAKGEWIVHRDGLKKIRQLKDGMGQYLWAPGLTAGAPDTLIDRPIIQSEYVPNTFTTGQYVIMFGDYSFYWIADAESMILQRLVELYAEANQVGFIGRAEVDGMPVLEEAFSRGKLA